MKTLPAALLALTLLWAAPTLRALEVGQALWGYDGQAVPGTFNPLSVFVSNRSAVAFDGALELAAGSGVSLGGSGGERAVAACYLAPGASRWVQFYPFFDNSHSADGAGWTLLWGRGANDRFELDPPKLAAPARVWLFDPDEGSPRATAGLRAFPDDLFPATVSATDGLAAIVLDHVPRWEAARRAAFLDWVRRGGIVHLVPDEAGREVSFTDELAPLNAPLDRQRVGAGLVVRHHGAAADLRQSGGLFADDPAPPTLEKGGAQTAVYDLEGSFFRQLARRAAPRVNWTLIYWLTVLYLVAVGPLHYLWARRRRDYRVSLAVLALGVAGFALLFGWVGRRGRGEAAQVTTLAWARPLGDGARCDVMQWSNAFVTRGGDYALTHPAPSNLYSGNGAAEVFAGRALSGLRGSYRVELPLFSSCALIHRGVMRGDPLPAEAPGAEKGVFKLPADFPAERFRKAFARIGGRFSRLTLRKERGTLEADADAPMDAADFLNAAELGKVNYGYRFEAAEEAGQHAADERLFSDCELALLARSLGGTDTFIRYVKTAPLPGEQAELFLFMAGEPAGFQMSGLGTVRETALVLYQRTYFGP